MSMEIRKRRGRPKKNDSVTVNICFKMNIKDYEKLKELQKVEGFEQFGTFVKSILLRYLNQYK